MPDSATAAHDNTGAKAHAPMTTGRLVNRPVLARLDAVGTEVRREVLDRLLRLVTSGMPTKRWGGATIDTRPSVRSQSDSSARPASALRRSGGSPRSGALYIPRLAPLCIPRSGAVVCPALLSRCLAFRAVRHFAPSGISRPQASGAPTARALSAVRRSGAASSGSVRLYGFIRDSSRSLYHLLSLSCVPSDSRTM
jgi:hypothetical protein